MARVGRPVKRKRLGLSRWESELRKQGLTLVAGVDEVGRGPLAGPVVAAAVILPSPWRDPGVADSKVLTPEAREELCSAVRAGAVSWGVGVVEPREIDRLNIHRASLLAMRRAVEALAMPPQHLIIDGRHLIELDLPQQAVVDGDAKVRCVAAASIVAKVARDEIMVELDARWPGYHFAHHKGYATAEHRQALARLGPCPCHRRSYKTVAQPWFEFGDETAEG